MLKLINVTKSYADKVAVKNLSFELQRGEIFGLLGPNGAGKTSTIRMICGITYPDKGTVEFLGRPMCAELQNKIGYLPEERGLYRKMTVSETLLYFAELKGLSRSAAKAHVEHWATRFDIHAWLKKKVEELSKGMQQKVQFISVVLHEPELLILDEPFSGLDPINSELIMDVIMELKKAGKTILFSTHRMEQVEKICDSIVLINNGEKVLGGSVREIKRAYGKNHLHLDFEGSDHFIDALVAQGKVEVSDRSPKSVELKLLNGTTPKDILTQIRSDTDITRFELAEPSLKEIFISCVGETGAARLAYTPPA
ncbi:MAG: ATP-binding cassette domain-containing protein [Chloroherpetonaceae bacterium]|nr:ATP-binding cassette domain-containing protein [Chloroherpetonaceae bacterium]MCS7210500.1 ATP-binding cassette domain-containing protein [Chloroherpetonaceae bacterium]MDW8019273.1 ATP-binding cassette domain-containing protein [Chloroherpetonaceae bacterium]